MDFIACKVREAIDRDGRTQYAIAKAAGIDRAHLSRYLRGKAELSVRTHHRLMDTLGIRLAMVWKDDGDIAVEPLPLEPKVQAKPIPAAPAPVQPRPVRELSQYELNKRKRLGMG